MSDSKKLFTGRKHVLKERKSLDKVTSRQKELFAKYCLEWAEKLGLQYVLFYFGQERLETAIAETRFEPSSNAAMIIIGYDWGQERMTDEGLNMLALHEVLHVLLCALLEGSPTDFFRSVSEQIIRRLVFLVFNKLWRTPRWMVWMVRRGGKKK
jgi:hypothetical protein